MTKNEPEYQNIYRNRFTQNTEWKTYNSIKSATHIAMTLRLYMKWMYICVIVLHRISLSTDTRALSTAEYCKMNACLKYASARKNRAPNRKNEK